MRISRERPLFQQIDRFLYSPAYIVYMGVLTVISAVFGLEIVAYPLMLLTGIYVCLCAKDLLPLVPIFAFGYISPSPNNNPGMNNDSIFSINGGGLYLAALLLALVISLVYRLVTDPDFGGKKFLQKKRSLLSGMLLLGAAYAISGLGSGQWTEYGWRNLLFAFLQFVAVAGLYYLFSGAVRWESAPKAYLFWTCLCVGYVLLAELVGIYLNNHVIVDGVIDRGKIAAGWGNYNSLGALFAMLLPLPFFLTGKGKFVWFAYLSAFLFCIGLLFTCSRTSVLVGIPVYFAGYVISLVNSRHARSKLWVHILSAIIVAIPVVMAIQFREELMKLFHVFPDMTSMESLKERFATYVEGFRQFFQFPVLGGSFFPLKEDLYKWAAPDTTFGYLFPPRWHNTVVQLLATGGVVCLVAYVIHRIQTVKLFVKQFSTEKLFVALSIAALLLMSMVDCHFFNVGPVLLYSIMLAVVEYQFNVDVDKK